jgi:hypothetical protein
MSVSYKPDYGAAPQPAKKPALVSSTKPLGRHTCPRRQLPRRPFRGGTTEHDGRVDAMRIVPDLVTNPAGTS